MPGWKARAALKAARNSAGEAELRSAEGGLPFRTRMPALARAAALGAVVIALLAPAAALLGRLPHIPHLDLAPDHSPAMRPCPAVALLLLAGGQLLLLRRPSSRRTERGGQLAAAAAVVVALLPPIAPVATTGLVLVAAAQAAMLPRRRRSVLPGQWLALGAVVVGQVSLYGFLAPLTDPGRSLGPGGIAFGTALALSLLGAAAFLSRPDTGLAALLTNAGTTGLLGRCMVGVTLTVLPFMGWFQLAGQQAGWFGERLGTAVVLCLRMCTLLGGSFAVLALARRSERARSLAERKVGEYAQLQAFMDHTPAVIFTRGPDGRFLSVNSRFEKVFDVPLERIIGHRVEDLLPPETAAAAAAGDRAVLADGRAVQLETVMPQSDGPHSFLTTLFPLTDGSGKPYAVCGVALDVTDRVLARREIEQQRQRFRDLLEAGPDATVISDGGGVIVMVNAQAEKLLGWERAELLGRPLGLLLPGGAERAEGDGTDLCARHRDGHDFPVEISMSPLMTEDGLLVSAAIRDITERRQAEAERRTLYEQQRQTALTLQHSLMGTPPDLPRLPTASRYLASAQEAGVGGDWFDLVPLDGGRTGVLIGDVMGRGVDAAAVMGQLRAAAHALAQTGMAPDRLVTALDLFVSELPDQLVTCCYLVLDPVAGELTVCSAGHLPALLALPATAPKPLDAPISVPLGVGGVPHLQATHPLLPGTTLLLYTDGLVETPDTDIDGRIQLLTDTLGSALDDCPEGPGPAGAELDRIADRLLCALLPVPEEYDDDVTLLLLRLPEAEDAAS
ncbi:SpoIIE family protein phosphatase [Streptacidiphilus albus]|uniref:SpoIIE family protein phosphatase n=1 Tax=Streptacidiphilus albus TaxID=105425 RepID=UPI00068C1AD9|nr:SpoIIE family protein phosphatase [Streptacidiphilus albus]